MELSANLTTYDITDRAVYSAGLYPGWGALDVPDYFYGFRLSFYWKNLYADILFRGAGDARFLTADMDYARVDYFGMKSLGVNYRIPLHRIFYGIPSGKDLIVYANAENLFTNVSSGFSTSEALAGYLNYPLYRLLSLGLKLNF